MAATLLAQISADVDGHYALGPTFAETVTGPSGDIAAIFSNEPQLSDAGGYVSASSSVPMLRTRNGDAMAKGAAVTIRGASYIVVEVMPDGFDETKHRLQKA